LIGMICATIANFSESFVKDEKTGKRKYWLPEEFIPDPLKEVVEKETSGQSLEEMELQLKSIATSANRTNKKRKK
jgi:hypothetical protein